MNIPSETPEYCCHYYRGYEVALIIEEYRWAFLFLLQFEQSDRSDNKKSKDKYSKTK